MNSKKTVNAGTVFTAFFSWAAAQKK